MKPEHVKYFYTLAGQTYNRKEPNDAECKAWIEVLGFYSQPELDAAWRRWLNDTSVEEFTQRPKGARMPTPAELKHSIERSKSAEDAKKNPFVACGKNGCVSGWVPVPEIGKKLTHRVRRCVCWEEYAMAFKQA